MPQEQLPLSEKPGWLGESNSASWQISQEAPLTTKQKGGSVQAIHPVHDPPLDVSHDCLIDIPDIGDDWFYAAADHALISAHAHTPAEEGFTILDGFRHLNMLAVGTLIHPVGLPGNLRLMGLVGEVSVSQLVPELTAGDLPVFDGQNQVIWSSTKVLADNLSFICDDCYFHVLSIDR
jgi:hypothetical protein